MTEALIHPVRHDWLEYLRDKAGSPLGAIVGSTLCFALATGMSYASRSAFDGDNETPPGRDGRGAAAAGPLVPGGTASRTSPSASKSTANRNAASTVRLDCNSITVREVVRGVEYSLTPVVSNVRGNTTSPLLFTLGIHIDPETVDTKAYVTPGIGAVIYRPRENMGIPLVEIIDFSGMDDPPETAAEINDRMPFGNSLSDSAITVCTQPDALLEIAERYQPE
ncbi:MAG TPA: hypothetical protein VF809_02150 [Candidatus Saccharimonadales bacterium]